jgi:hypothetical protein
MHHAVKVLVLLSMQSFKHLLLLQMDVLWHGWVPFSQEWPMQERM